MTRIIYERVEGSQAIEPSAVDAASSPGHVYLRKNVTREERTDENGDRAVFWHYDEAILTLAEYDEWMAQAEGPVLVGIMQELAAIRLQIDEMGV